MFSTLILAASVAGQSCNLQQRAYAAPVAYRQTYAANNYVQQQYYAPQVQTAYIAVEYRDYANIIGSEQRGVNRRQEALLSQAALAARVDKLSASINGLTAIIAKEAVGPVEPTPVAPGKPVPVVPGKPSPEVPGKPNPTVEAPPPVQPPTPTVNPDDGSVPPPPVPTAPGVAVPDATVQVLKARCAACHSAESAATNGGKFALFAEDGSVRPLSSPKLLDLAFRVSTGNMPRKALPLPPDEQTAIKAWVLGDPKVAGFLGATPAGAPK
jgi:mono/diheme cytochrome c family protein